MAVIWYQLAIVVTLILVRLISPKHLQGAALVWTALTVINLFWPPLIVVQLIVIWVTYGVLTRPDPPPEPPKPALDRAVKIARKPQTIDLGAYAAPVQPPAPPPAVVPPAQPIRAAPAPAVAQEVPASHAGEQPPRQAPPSEAQAGTRWSVQQNAIFDFFATGKGNAAVRARAGTGKTTTILEGITYAPESDIVLAAFNKRIADELLTKLKNPAATAKTLHALGFAAVKTYWNGTALDKDRGLTLARRAAGHQSPDLMIKLIRKLAAYGKNIAPFGSVADLVELAIQFDVEPDTDWSESGWDTEKVAKCAHEAMRLATQRDGTVDFDDMIFVPVAMKMVHPKYDLVVIDEAQDMNLTQLLLAQKLVHKGGRTVVVGDDRQAIYGFRGADSKSLDRFKSELSAVEFPLTTTYRCPKKVVALAQQLVPDYRAADTAPEGIVREVSNSKLVDEATPGCFILSRKNAPLVSTCIKLLKRGKRAKVEGKDIGRSLLTIVKKLGGTTIESFLTELAAWEEREMNRARLAAKDPEPVIERIADQAGMLVALCEGLFTTKELEARIENLFDDAAEGAQPLIICSSVHKAKGLERERVFLLKDTFSRTGTEECNIEYVAITRAKQELIWVVNEDSNRSLVPMTLEEFVLDDRHDEVPPFDGGSVCAPKGSLGGSFQTVTEGREPMTSTDQEVRILTGEEADKYLSMAPDLLSLGNRLIFRISEGALETHRERLRATFPAAVLRPIPPPEPYTSGRPVAYEHMQKLLDVEGSFRDFPPCVKLPTAGPPGGGYERTYVGSGVPASEHPLANGWFSRCMNCASKETRVIYASSATHFGSAETSRWNECWYECLECGKFNYHQTNYEY
ncbi:ATP-dependent helicase [Archangium sp.]|uniref:ATP-dependent helicase n=1 Tax=Archangium sp. TaxID=1872627 RepID=UPI002D531F6A|nr:ATP-dependent helicase [Archangium sp.]HYO56978.1 ATP-dependent helicase [Archangium sp.]